MSKIEIISLILGTNILTVLLTSWILKKYRMWAAIMNDNAQVLKTTMDKIIAGHDLAISTSEELEKLADHIEKTDRIVEKALNVLMQTDMNIIARLERLEIEALSNKKTGTNDDEKKGS